MIELTEIEYEDLKELKKYRNLYYSKFRQYQLLSMADQEKWYKNNFNNSFMFAIRENNKLIGCCGLCYIDLKNRSADLSLYLFDSYIDDRCNEVLDKLLDYAFNELGLNRVYNDLFEYDIKKHDLFIKYGFKQEGIAYEKYYRDGKFHNANLYCYLRKQFEKKNEEI